MDLSFLKQVASIFREAAEAMDRFDWLREALQKLKERTEDQSIFARLDEVLSSNLEKVEVSEYDEIIKLELTNIIKYFM